MSPQLARVSGGVVAVLQCAAYAAALFATGCLVGPNYERPEVELPAQWRSADDPRLAGEPATPTEWWKSFNDPVLDGLVEDVLAQNLNLEAAALRIVQARLGAIRATEVLFPAVTGPSVGIGQSFPSTTVRPPVDVTAPSVSVSPPQFSVKPPGVTVDRRFPNLRIPLPDVSVTPPEVSLTKPQVSVTPPRVDITPRIDLFSSGFDALWEVDLWGKNRRRVEAANADTAAAEADYDAILVSLAAETAAAYVRIRTLQERLAILADLAAMQKKVLDDAEALAKAGKATEVDPNLVRALLMDTRSRIPPLEGAMRAAENDLCVLLGKPPHDIQARLKGAAAVPVLPKDTSLGLPADLLRRRPDVRRAERAAAAQCARIGEAAGHLYPSFKILGSIGFNTSNPSDWFTRDSFGAAYGGGVSWNILLYPFIIQRVRIEDARFQEAILNYKETVLRAAREVENASTAYVKLLDESALLSESAQAATKAAEVGVAKYADASLPLGTVFEALNWSAIQRDRTAALRGEIVLMRIAVFKALGGGWQTRASREILSETTKEQLRGRSEWNSFFGSSSLETKIPPPADQ